MSEAQLNKTEKKGEMESLIFLREKKDGLVKAWHCGNGSTQQDYMLQKSMSRPTVNMESTLLIAVIQAEENREVAKCNIPNSFIQTEVEAKDSEGNWTILKIRGFLVDLLYKISLCYAAFVQEERQGRVLYLHVKKAIYGMLESALLSCKNLSSDLMSFGFIINPYDPWVANKQVGD
jgi:hypothetical protein